MKCKESILMIWLVLLIHGAGFTSDDDDRKIVYVQKGGVAHFKLDTKKPVAYARIGSPEKHGINLEELYMRAALKNNSLHINRINNTRYSQRLGFHGNNLSQGASFILRDITAEDNKAVFRVSYRELGKAPTKRDFEIVLKEQPDEPATKPPPSTGTNVTNNTTENPDEEDKVTPTPPITGTNDTSTTDPPDDDGLPQAVVIVIVIIVVFILLILLFVLLYKKGLIRCPWIKKRKTEEDSMELGEANIPSDNEIRNNVLSGDMVTPEIV